MRKDKLIEEMANEIMKVVMRNRNMRQVAETLYNAGYRKASDVAMEICAKFENLIRLYNSEYKGATFTDSWILAVLKEIKEKYGGEG